MAAALMDSIRCYKPLAIQEHWQPAGNECDIGQVQGVLRSCLFMVVHRWRADLFGLFRGSTEAFRRTPRKRPPSCCPCLIPRSGRAPGCRRKVPVVRSSGRSFHSEVPAIPFRRPGRQWDGGMGILGKMQISKPFCLLTGGLTPISSSPTFQRQKQNDEIRVKRRPRFGFGIGWKAKRTLYRSLCSAFGFQWISAEWPGLRRPRSAR